MNIFVSGVLDDMHTVQDVFENQIRPPLSRKVQEKYGQQVDFTILRNTGTLIDPLKTTLSCLEAIAETDPTLPIVFLLGSHCAHLITSENVKIAEKEFSFTTKYDPRSITELEIEYGVLRDWKLLSRAIFCYIDAEDQKPDEAMRALRRKLSQHIPAEQILHFIQTKNGIISANDYRPFSRILAQRLWMHIATGYVQPSHAQQEATLHRSYMRQTAAFFRGRKELFDSGIQQMAQRCPVLLLTGEACSGKSALLSRLLLAAEPNCTVLPIYCGLTENVGNAMDVLRHILCSLEATLRVQHEEPTCFDAWKDRLEQLCNLYENSGLPQLVIGIDGVDQLPQSNIARELLFLPCGSYQNLQFIVSFPSDIPIPPRFSRAPVIILSHSQETETRETIRQILSERKRHTLTAIDEDDFVAQAQSTAPIFLDIIQRALRLADIPTFNAGTEPILMQDVCQIHDQLLRHFRNRDLLSMCRAFLMFACQKIDVRLYPSLVNIATAPHGLTIDLLADLEPDTFSPESFLLLYHYLRDIFILHSDGRYDFAHKCWRQSLNFVNLKQQPDHPQISRRVFDLLYGLEDTHPIRTSDILYSARQCGQIVFSIQYIVNAFQNDQLQHRRKPILRMMKDLSYCQQLVEGLPKYLVATITEKANLVEALPKAMTLLHGYTAVFRNLFIHDYNDRRDETFARAQLYFNFLTKLDNIYTAIQTKILEYQEVLELTVMPYMAYQAEWFLACATYDRLLQEKKLYVPDAHTPEFIHLRRGIATDFLSPLGKQQLRNFHGMDRDTFQKRFFAHPNRVFREVFRYWLNEGWSVDLTRLIDAPEEIEKYFIRIYPAVLEVLLLRDPSAVDLSNERYLRYRRVSARAKALHVSIPKHFAFFKPFRHLYNQSPSSTPTTYPEFIDRYRDLDHRESTEKYVAFLRYAESALHTLSSRTDEAISCCRNAITIAERATNYSLGRCDCIAYYFTFCATMRQLLDAINMPARLHEIESVYARQFYFLLNSPYEIHPSIYENLMGLDYPKAMQRLYDDAQLAAPASRRAAWYQQSFDAAIALLKSVENDYYLWRVASPYEELDPEIEAHHFTEAHDRLLGTVCVALDALEGLNHAIDGFDASDAAMNMYDDLREYVFEDFSCGSFRYPGSALKQRISTLMKLQEFPLFSEVLCQIDEHLALSNTSEEDS